MKVIKRIAQIFLGLLGALIVLLLLPGIPRKDVLECGFPDGSKFIATARYDWYPAAMIARPVRERVYRSGWSVTYKDKGVFGHQSRPPTSANYAGTDENALRGVCAKAGAKRNGIPMVKYSFLQPNGEWLPTEGFPWKQMNIPTKMQDSKFGNAGFSQTPLLYALIMPLKDGRLVYEQPLSTNRKGYSYDIIFDGVYQAFSTDNGKTWSDPVITTNALIFEMGKRWIDQCLVPRPIEFNGDKITPDFPAPCPPNP